MASHWYIPPQTPGDAEDPDHSRHIAVLADQTLEQLLRKPDLNGVIASTKAWCRATWFTTDGNQFYLRDDVKGPDMDLPPSLREEVIVLGQEQYRRFLRYTHLYDRFLQPKIQKIMDSEMTKLEKIDRIYWIRLSFPAHVACRVPVVFEGNIERFCWGWDYYRHQEGRELSKSDKRSNRLINHLFVDTSILWSY